jgi:hypothetical protein
MTNAAPPGWYTHADTPGVEHWWDGTQYSQSRPVAQAVVHYAVVRPAGVSPKSRTVAALLGFFLGGLGVDRFYLGNIGMGVAKLLLGWLTLGIWPLIDWIIILAGAAHDGDGLAVTEWN